MYLLSSVEKSKIKKMAYLNNLITHKQIKPEMKNGHDLQDHDVKKAWNISLNVFFQKRFKY